MDLPRISKHPYIKLLSNEYIYDDNSRDYGRIPMSNRSHETSHFKDEYE